MATVVRIAILIVCCLPALKNECNLLAVTVSTMCAAERAILDTLVESSLRLVDGVSSNAHN